MLSFLQEPENEKAKDVEPKASNFVQGFADDNDSEYIEPVSQDKNLKNTTMMLAAFFVIGLVGLWLMITKSSPGMASAQMNPEEDALITQAIAEFTGTSPESETQMKTVVTKFYEISDIHQVPINDLVKNPFEQDLYEGDAANTNVLDTDQLNTQELTRRAEKFQLLSIMKSDQESCCVIDDSLLYEGDMIQGFTVTKIESNLVELKSAGTSIFLRMEND